jgi:hypothetical protein
MNRNANESSTAADDGLGLPVRANPTVAIFPILWAGLLFLGLPAVQGVPTWFRVLSTVLTVWAIATLPKAASGWWHLLLSPIYLLLVFLQLLVWIFPFDLR